MPSCIRVGAERGLEAVILAGLAVGFGTGIMYYIAVKSVLAAIRGHAVGWVRVERKATVVINQEQKMGAAIVCQHVKGQHFSKRRSTQELNTERLWANCKPTLCFVLSCF